MDELSEVQFTLIKNLCNDGVGLVIVPVWVEGDPEQYAETYTKNFAELQHIVKLGFFEDITSTIPEAVEESVKRTGRGFVALKITEQAIQMFGRPEGSVN
jgi:hypothetical protein